MSELAQPEDKAEGEGDELFGQAGAAVSSLNDAAGDEAAGAEEEDADAKMMDVDEAVEAELEAEAAS